MTTFFMPIPSDQLVPAFIDYLRFEKRLSMHTVKAYTEDLNQFFQYTSRSVRNFRSGQNNHYLYKELDGQPG